MDMRKQRQIILSKSRKYSRCSRKDADLYIGERISEDVKFNFNRQKTRTMGIRVSEKDYMDIEKLAKKYHRTRCGIASELVRSALVKCRQSRR